MTVGDITPAGMAEALAATGDDMPSRRPEAEQIQ
jgi:hypothetical protein